MEEFMENFLKTELDKSVKELLPPTLTGKFQELMAEQITKKVMDLKSTDNTENLTTSYTNPLQNQTPPLSASHEKKHSSSLNKKSLKIPKMNQTRKCCLT